MTEEEALLDDTQPFLIEELDIRFPRLEMAEYDIESLIKRDAVEEVCRWIETEWDPYQGGNGKCLADEIRVQFKIGETDEQ